jgi:hypothetical protein
MTDSGTGTGGAAGEAAATTPPATDAPAAATPAAAVSRRNRGSRAARKAAAQQQQAGAAARPKETKFDGRCEELTGHTYDVISLGASADRFTRTTEEIIGYLDKTYKHGADVSTSLQNLATEVIPKPTDPVTTGADAETNKEIWKQEVRVCVSRKAELKENLQKAYALIWGQCSDALRAKIESDSTHAQVAADKDSIRLLMMIQAAMYMTHAQRCEPLTLVDGIDRFMRLRQGKHQTLRRAAASIVVRGYLLFVI